MKRKAGNALKEKTIKNISSRKFNLFDEHPDHDRHLCHIVNLRNLKTVAKLARNPQHICFACGRAAKSDKNLCEPVKMA